MKIIYTILALFLSYFHSYAQWDNISGNRLVTLSSVTAMGSISFAGGYGGVYWSNHPDSGWVKINTGLTDARTNALAVSGNTIFAGTWAGVFRSQNNTGIWSPANNGITNDTIQCLLTDSANIFAGTNGGLFISSNGGVNWSPLVNGLTCTYVFALAVSGNNLFAGTDNGVFHSTNNGLNWTNIGFAGESIFALTVNDTTIYAGKNNGLFLKTLNALNWSSGITSNPVYALCSNGNDIYAGGNNGIMESHDDGITWTWGSSGSLNSVNDVYINNNDVIIATDQGVYESKLSTPNTWTLRSLYLPNNTCYSFVGAGADILTTDGGTLYRTPDNGRSWYKIDSIGGINALEKNGNDIYACGSGIYRSTDNGYHWSLLDSSSILGHVYSIIFRGNTFYASAVRGILISVDYGNTWSKISSGLTIASLPYFAVAANGNELFSSNGNIYYSPNNGTSWSYINTPQIFNVKKLFLDGGNLYSGSCSDGVMMSPNGLSNWTTVNNGISNLCVNDLYMYDHYNYFCAAIGDVYVSHDAGASWISMGQGLPTMPDVESVRVVGAKIYVGLDNGDAYSRDTIQLINRTDDINNQDNVYVELFPNPAIERVYVQSERKINSITCVDFIGREFKLQILDNKINVSDLVNGVYLLSFKFESGAIIFKKLIKN